MRILGLPKEKIKSEVYSKFKTPTIIYDQKKV